MNVDSVREIASCKRWPLVKNNKLQSSTITSKYCSKLSSLTNQKKSTQSYRSNQHRLLLLLVTIVVILTRLRIATSAELNNDQQTLNHNQNETTTNGASNGAGDSVNGVSTATVAIDEIEDNSTMLIDSGLFIGGATSTEAYKADLLSNSSGGATSGMHKDDDTSKSMADHITIVSLHDNRQGYHHDWQTTVVPMTGGSLESSDTRSGPSSLTSSVLVGDKIEMATSPSDMAGRVFDGGIDKAAGRQRAPSIDQERHRNDSEERSVRTTNSKLLSSPTSSSAKEYANENSISSNYGNQFNLRNSMSKEDELLFAKNVSNVYDILLKKKPYSKYWSVEQKWDDIFKRFIEVQGMVKSMMAKSFLKDIEYYADVSLSQNCQDDLKYIQDYVKKSTNIRWLMHMADALGKSEAGMLTGNMANLGHVVQCIKVRAPEKFSNDSFEEQYFERQAELLGERFRGKYCLASIRPVLPEKPYLISRFSDIVNTSMLSNLSFTGEPAQALKKKIRDYRIPVKDSYDAETPFESELYEYLITQRNFMYTLPRFMGVCYPSSCSRNDIKTIMQRSNNDEHQVIDIEFNCEMEEYSAWDWYITPRLICYVLLFLLVGISFLASLSRYILVDKLNLNKRIQDGKIKEFLSILDLLSMDKCAGILFVKTKRATSIVDPDKIENERSTSIDALRGFLMLVLIYSELVHLGCLPVPFMWSKWVDAMFPFYRSPITQIFLNTLIWTESFYIISAYLITTKMLENFRQSPLMDVREKNNNLAPDFASFVIRRYVRLILPSLGFIMFNYVWPRLSNGFVMQDQASKLMSPCDNNGWTNLLLFHNNFNPMNETCLWPSHVSATFFQLHLISYPIIILLLSSLRSTMECDKAKRLRFKLKALIAFSLMIIFMLFGLLYSALQATDLGLIVPFLIDYIDYDNYQRVIEYTVMPTHNHLTSYMIGIFIGYSVIRKRIDREQQEVVDGQQVDVGTFNISNAANYMQRENSFESVTTSSESFNRPVSSMSMLGADRIKARSRDRESDSSDTSDLRWYIEKIKSGVVLTICILCLMSSSFWNTLGQPMTSKQTFWYLISTKLVFSITFAYIFYKHFAERRNCSNPWMLTRFLVPIGRMSLILFYMSWIVIWFDLLASLYQWHPSHYFVFEKYNEIMFMTLILSMFAYGVFEGIVKRIQNEQEVNERKGGQDNKSLQASKSEQLKGFHLLFRPLDEGDCAPTTVEGMQTVKVTEHESDNKLLAGDKSSSSYQVEGFRQQDGKTYLNISNSGKKPLVNKHLSMVDQYKLNAELRANYSFASIGLYESAGAADDLRLSATPKQQHHKQQFNRAQNR